MKILIVNADDFGKSKGINQGIIQRGKKLELCQLFHRQIGHTFFYQFFGMQAN